MSESPVMIMAGGTGGHIFPGLAVADSLDVQDIPVVWLGSAHGMENQLVPAHGLPLEVLTISGLRGKGIMTLLKAPFLLIRAVIQALRIMSRHKPRCVLSMGGFAAGPGGLAAWLGGRPVLVHEQNRVPGLTNRVLAKLARRVLAGFPDAFPESRVLRYVGNPVRASISSLPEPSERFEGRSGRPRLLVIGGSQGATTLNQTLPEALKQMPDDQRPEVWHQMGARHIEQGRAQYQSMQIEGRLEPFIDDMANAYGWADLVICRAGALTLAEITAAGLACILVPFPHAVDDHQTRNAEFLVGAGAAELMPESMLNPRLLANRMGSLLSSREQLLRMADNARRLARPNAAADVAAACIEEGR